MVNEKDCGIILLYTVSYSLYWLNKQADWQISEQDKVRWGSQTKNEGMKKGRVRGVRARLSISGTHKMG